MAWGFLVWVVVVAGHVAASTDGAGVGETTDMVATAHHAIEDMDSLAATKLLP